MQSDSQTTVGNESLAESLQTTKFNSFSWDILRTFPLQSSKFQKECYLDEILESLTQKREELKFLEDGIELFLQLLLKKVIDDRIAYENNKVLRVEERNILKEYE